MPRPWKSDGASMYSGSLVNERPVCAAFLGEIVAQWAHTEAFLAQMYSELVVGCVIPGVPMHPGSWIAMETFEVVNNFAQKRKMLTVAAHRRGFVKQTVDDFGKLLNKLQKAGDARIVAAHGRWMMDSRYPVSLIWQENAGNLDDALIYDITDFQDDLNRIVQRLKDVTDFWSVNLRPTIERATKFGIMHLRAVENFEDPI